MEVVDNCGSFFSYEQKSLVAKVQRREMPDMGMLFLNIKVRRSHLISDSLNEVSLASNLLCALSNVILKGPSQPPPLSMPSILLILHSEVKSECFTIRCVPESTLNYL